MSVDAPKKEKIMLVITRKIGQEIWIGDEIRITVQEMRGRQVRIAISAPEGMVITRPETIPVDKTSELLSQTLSPTSSVFARPTSVAQLPVAKPKLTLPEDLPPAQETLTTRLPRIQHTNRRPPRVL